MEIDCGIHPRVAERRLEICRQRYVLREVKANRTIQRSQVDAEPFQRIDRRMSGLLAGRRTGCGAPWRTRGSAPARRGFARTTDSAERGTYRSENRAMFGVRRSLIAMTRRFIASWSNGRGRGAVTINSRHGDEFPLLSASCTRAHPTHGMDGTEEGARFAVRPTKSAATRRNKLAPRGRNRRTSGVRLA